MLAWLLTSVFVCCEGEANDSGVVGSCVKGCAAGTDDTLGGFEIIGPLEVKLGDGLGTGIIPVPVRESVGVGGI